MLSAYAFVFLRVQVHYGRGLGLFETFVWMRKEMMVTNEETASSELGAEGGKLGCTVS